MNSDGDVGELLRQFGPAWAERPPALGLREERAEDLDIVRRLYASTRAAELAQVDWPEATKRAFVEQQFQAQHQQYRQHYAGAAFLLIEQDSAIIGRIYLHATRHELRLMEITLRPESRRARIGSALLGRLLQLSDARGLPLSLHVEPFNPAHAWYQRLGFQIIEHRGAYDFMQRPAAATASA